MPQTKQGKKRTQDLKDTPLFGGGSLPYSPNILTESPFLIEGNKGQYILVEACLQPDTDTDPYIINYK